MYANKHPENHATSTDPDLSVVTCTRLDPDRDETNSRLAFVCTQPEVEQVVVVIGRDKAEPGWLGHVRNSGGQVLVVPEQTTDADALALGHSVARAARILAGSDTEEDEVEALVDRVLDATSPFAPEPEARRG